ncbi:pentapeptide repeat-containing protein [Streptomyces sp. NPDC059569]|uniref:pentapeptide repeat-containing protein n=1 Tax=Streptomyces sp. NPDC059569 TaxID=3346869 RepID=UPI0036B31474
MISNPFRNQSKGRNLPLWPITTVLVVSFTVALVVASSVFTAGWGLLDVHGLKPEHTITSQTLFDLVKLSFGVVAGAGGLVALVVAYRRQRIDEEAALRENEGALREAIRLHTERFTAAVSHLGDSSPAVRLGGVHALAGLADDAPSRELRQTCIDVLCAYLRLPYTVNSDAPNNDPAARHEYLALRQVRHTIIRLIRDHLRLCTNHPHTWQGHDFDFTDGIFDGGDFTKANFSGDGLVDFGGARFGGGMLDFSEARFAGGKVSFRGARISSVVSFSGAHFSGSAVEFDNTLVDRGLFRFDDAHLNGGVVNFRNVRFRDCEVSFTETRFAGTAVTFGDPSFYDSGPPLFRESRFTECLFLFLHTHFNDGIVDFRGTAFMGGNIVFGDAHFSGSAVNFSCAHFGNRMSFGRTFFSGGVVDFCGSDPEHHATGTAPSGLVPDAGQPLPRGLLLPPAWYISAP